MTRVKEASFDRCKHKPSFALRSAVIGESTNLHLHVTTAVIGASTNFHVCVYVRSSVIGANANIHLHLVTYYDSNKHSFICMHTYKITKLQTLNSLSVLAEQDCSQVTFLSVLEMLIIWSVSAGPLIQSLY